MIDIFMFQIFFLVKEFKLALKNMEETLFLFDNKLNFYISLHFGVISIIFSKWQGINLNLLLYPLIWGFVSYTFLTLLFAFLLMLFYPIKSGYSYGERQGKNIAIENISIIISWSNGIITSLSVLVLLTSFTENVYLYILTTLIPFFFIFSGKIKKFKSFYFLNYKIFLIINVIFIIGDFFLTELENSLFHKLIPCFIVGLIFTLKSLPKFFAKTIFSCFFSNLDINLWTTKTDYTLLDKSYNKYNIKGHKKLIDNTLINSFQIKKSVQFPIPKMSDNIVIGVGVEDNLTNGKVSVKVDSKLVIERDFKSIDKGWNWMGFPVDTNKKAEIFVTNSKKNKIHISAPFILKNIQPKRNIIVLVIDALSKDLMSAYNSKRNLPNIDQFFKNGAIYNDAFVQSEWTTSCFANMFTSHYSSHHKTNNRFDSLKHRLMPSQKTIAQVLQENSYVTSFYSGSRRVSQRTGYDRGFDITYCDEYENLFGDSINKHIFNQFDKFKNNNKFSVLHYMDTHGPPIFWSHYKDFNSNFRKIKVRETYRSNPKEWEELYYNQALECDFNLGRVFDFLSRPEHRDNTSVILTADHGSPINFFKEKTNDPKSQYDQYFSDRMNNVPLMVNCPWNINKNAGLINGMIESGIDLYPSILELAKIKDADSSKYSKSYIIKDKTPFQGKDYTVTESIYEGVVKRIIRTSDGFYFSQFDWTNKKNNSVNDFWEIDGENFKKKNSAKRIKDFIDLEKKLNLVSENSNPENYYGPLNS